MIENVDLSLFSLQCYYAIKKLPEIKTMTPMTIINVSRSFIPGFLLAGSSDFERGLAKIMTSMHTEAKMPSAT